GAGTGAAERGPPRTASLASTAISRTGPRALTTGSTESTEAVRSVLSPPIYEASGGSVVADDRVRVVAAGGYSLGAGGGTEPALSANDECSLRADSFGRTRSATRISRSGCLD